MNEDLQVRLVSAILDADRALANQLIGDWAANNGYDRAMIEVVSPVLDEIGMMYAETGEFSLAQGYVAGKVAEDTLAKVFSHQDLAAPKATKGPVVIGNIEDDYHPLGRKMVGIFLQAAGWQVYDLGIDVTAEEFVEKALEVNARVVGASAMIYTTAVNIEALRKEIDHRGLSGSLQLAVGGAVFKLRPELLEEVGGDGTADNALNAPTLFEELWNASLEKGEIK
jgi:methylmalonyl-CoA mutase cobalamin-binding domain/chain